MNSLPTVSILMPIRNEAAFISRSLGAVLAQDYPADRLEVIVVDGMSTDGSPQIVESLAARHPNLRLIENPQQIVPTGLNVSWAQAHGAIIIRVDGHCEISRDYVRRCVDYLRHGDIDGIGGPLETVGETPLGEAIALAMQSPFGVGGAAFRNVTNKTMLTDTVAFPAYKRAIMERAGPYDEKMSCNEDDEYNYRLAKLGAKLLLAKDIHSKYYCRNHIGALGRQYFRYGYWKVPVLQKHPRQMRLRHFVPAVFAAALLALAALGVFFPVCRLLLAMLAGSYALANLAASVWAGRKSRWHFLWLLPFVFATLHFSYGIGFLSGLVKFCPRWKKGNDVYFSSPGNRSDASHTNHRRSKACAQQPT